MADVLVRNLPDETVAALKARAAMKGVSLNSLLRDLLQQAVPLSAEDRLAALDAVRALMKPGGPSAVELIREDRDSR